MLKKKKPRSTGVSGRERLLKVAVRLFAAKGYAATSVRDILRAADVTAPVLYYHFGNKEGLFLALVREGVQKIETAVGKALEQGGSATDKVRSYCHAIAAIRREYADMAWIIEAILSGSPEAAPRFDFRGKFEESLRQLARLVQDGIESGEFRACDPIHAASALLGAVEMVARPHLLQPRNSSHDDQLEGMLSVILNGLAASAV